METEHAGSLREHKLGEGRGWEVLICPIKEFRAERREEREERKNTKGFSQR